MAKRAIRRQRERNKSAPERMDVTPERLQHGNIVSMGMARKLIPVIDTLHEAGKLTDRQYAALKYYRDQASLADHSPIKDSVGSLGEVTGGGNGPGVAITSAMIETGRLEGELGSLQPLARAVAVDDTSLTEWAIQQGGGRERYEKGAFVAMVPRDPKGVEMALMELKFAASRIME